MGIFTVTGLDCDRTLELALVIEPYFIELDVRKLGQGVLDKAIRQAFVAAGAHPEQISHTCWKVYDGSLNVHYRFDRAEFCYSCKIRLPLSGGVSFELKRIG